MINKYLYIGTHRLFTEKLLNAEEYQEVIQVKTPLSAIEYLSCNKDVSVVIYEADSNSEQAGQFIHFYRENISANTLFFVLVQKPKQIHELALLNVDDIFTFDIAIEKLRSRAEFLLANKRYFGDSKASLPMKYNTPFWKRTVDIGFALATIVALLPVFLLIAISIRLESKGKVFYSAKRVGAGYKVFNFYKFRSMYTDADKKVDSLMAKNQYVTKNSLLTENELNTYSGEAILYSDDTLVSESTYLKEKANKQENSFFKVAKDPRITKVGRIIRNTSLDELPQLFNILKGDMSVVGNRPLPLYEAEMLTGDRWVKRFLAPAGLTGLWQVTKRGGANRMSADDRKQLDIEYASSYSFWGDMSIIFRTFPAILQHENV